MNAIYEFFLKTFDIKKDDKILCNDLEYSINKDLIIEFCDLIKENNIINQKVNKYDIIIILNQDLNSLYNLLDNLNEDGSILFYLNHNNNLDKIDAKYYIERSTYLKDDKLVKIKKRKPVNHKFHSHYMTGEDISMLRETSKVDDEITSDTCDKNIDGA